MLIRIAYLYPELMNIYGDRGNILCFLKRCQWRGIETEVEKITLKDSFTPGDFDFYFAGGGQDREQILVAKDLQTRKKVLKEEAERGVPMLLICGSYQLFGHYFKTFDGKKLPGISILDCYTVASKKRKIGNVIVKPAISYQLSPASPRLSRGRAAISYLLGFENHSGNTFMTKVKSPAFASSFAKATEDKKATAGRQKSPASPRRSQERAKVKTYPLGKVIKGFGNNGQDRTEGAIYKNVIGTYLHGPILPKNPELTDFLIKKALETKYQKKIALKPLDDKLEENARRAFLKRFLPLKHKLTGFFP